MDNILDERQELESLFLDANKFFTIVEDKVWMDDISYLDAIMSVCDDKEINPEDLVRLHLISPLLKSKLYSESMESGLIKQESSLPGA